MVRTHYPDERDTWLGLGRLRAKTREHRAMFVDVKTGKVTHPFKRVFLRKFDVLPPNLANFVDFLPNDPDHVLMALPDFDGGPANVVYKVNIRNQRNTVVKHGDNNVLSWSTGPEHRIRLGREYDEGVFATRVKNVETGEWRRLWPHKAFSRKEVNAIGFGKDPDKLYIQAYHQGRQAIFRVDLSDPELERELMLADPEYDIGGHLIYDESGEAIGISSGASGGTRFFEGHMSGINSTIDKALPAPSNAVYDLTANKQRFLVFSTGSTESGTYYLGQTDPLKLSAIGYRYRNLPPKVLSVTRDYSYRARDGLPIEGWLTLPRGRKAKNLPTIVFPHGGPQSRDSGEFDYWGQFFASRGYAVLRMNFRGSQGLGFKHRQAGLQNWGKQMQDDIQDGALKLIEDGISDPDRICIAGGSYGGYAALMGLVKTPDFYRCGISFAGVSDVVNLVRHNRNFRSSHNIVDKQVGKIGDGLDDISPINHAQAIKAPVLLIHGDLDRQVRVEQSRRMYEALKKADKDVRYIELEGEDHYLKAEKHRLRTFKAMDAFLAEHLPAKID